jgi:glycosyltransferase involved in cell wall biosynthesis
MTGTVIHKKTVKVAMLTDYPLHDLDLVNGGVINVAYWLIQGLSVLNGLELYVLVPRPDMSSEVVRKFGNTTVIYFPRRLRYVDHFIQYHNLQRSVDSLIDRIRPELIHAQGNPEYILAAVRTKIPHVVTIHGIFKNELPIDRATNNFRNYFRERAGLIAEKYYIPRIKNLFVVTDEVIKFVHEFNPAVRSFRVSNPIDDIFFTVKDRSIPSEQIILFIAAIRHRKGLHILIEAFKKLLNAKPDLKLRILGRTDWDEDYVADLKHKNRLLIDNGNIDFLGVVSQQIMLDEYGKCTVFCLPSFAESQPMVIIQALAAGKPVVSTSVGGIPQMIADGINGYLVPPQNSNRLYLALEKILNDETKRQDMAKEAKENAILKYSSQQIAAITFTSYCEILDRN